MPWLLWMEKAQASRSGTWVLVSSTPGPPFTVHLSLLISWVTPPTNLTTACPSLENLSTRPRAPFTRPEDTWARGKKLVCVRQDSNLQPPGSEPGAISIRPRTLSYREISWSFVTSSWLSTNIAMRSKQKVHSNRNLICRFSCNLFMK